MLSKFLRLTILAILCISLAGKVLAQDYCDNSEPSKNKSVISHNNLGDLSDSSDKSDCQDCNCHCHHHHLDFASLDESFTMESATIEKFPFYLSSSTSQINSTKKPPKIAS